MEPLILPENDDDPKRPSRSSEAKTHSFKVKLAAEDTLFYKPNESLAEVRTTYSKHIVLEWFEYSVDTDRSLSTLFKAVDENQTGHLRKRELEKALVNADYTSFDENTVGMMMAMFDVNRSGSFDYDQYWYANFTRPRLAFLSLSLCVLFSTM